MAASIPAFDEKLESWDSYEERLGHYFVALEIDDLNKKKSILINCIGPANYERVRNLCFPSSPSDKSYEELLLILSQLFKPSTVVFKERKQFYDARKYKNETATNWHERVRKLALNCKFGARTEQTLLDKYVTSYDGIVFDRFCEESTDLTLAKALDIAQRYQTIEGASAPKPPFKNPNQYNGNEQQQRHPGPKPHQKQSGQGQHPKKFNPKNTTKKTSD